MSATAKDSSMFISYLGSLGVWQEIGLFLIIIAKSKEPWQEISTDDYVPIADIFVATFCQCKPLLLPFAFLTVTVCQCK
jgi:hypothetical protein